MSTVDGGRLCRPPPGTRPAHAAAWAKPWGAPDPQGIWDFAPPRPSSGPRIARTRRSLRREEAASIEEEWVDPNIHLWEAPARRTAAGGTSGGYNNFWLDFGTNVIEDRRTSLVVDPPEGRIPALSEEGQRRADERRAYREAHPADSYLDRNAFDRCILGSNTGPPMTPGFYNQNNQLFQTPDHVVVLKQMVHDARIIPLDGRPRPDIESRTGESRAPERATRWWSRPRTSATNTAAEVRRRTVTSSSGSPGSTRSGHAALRVHEHRPATWTAPWATRIRMQWNELPLFEYACHDGNYAMPNILGVRARRSGTARAGRSGGRGT